MGIRTTGTRRRIGRLVFLVGVLGAPTGIAGQADQAGQAEGFQATLDRVQSTRAALAKRYARARTGLQKRAIKKEARRFVTRILVDEIFPAWMGTPWHMGADDDAEVPHQSGKRVSCSYFVTAALQNVGLVLDNRKRWADAPALHIQRSLAPRVADVHRFFSITPASLSSRLARLPHGLYVVGLNCHVGFIRVEPGGVWFIHSDYVEPEIGVRAEPVATSAAIGNSRSTGYWVTPLFQDDRLIGHWLTGHPVPLLRLGQIRGQARAGGSQTLSTRLLFLD